MSAVGAPRPPCAGSGRAPDRRRLVGLATERSVHDGQRTSVSIAAARCAAVWRFEEHAAADDQRHGEHGEREAEPDQSGSAARRRSAPLERQPVSPGRLRATYRGSSRWPGPRGRGHPAGRIDDERGRRRRHPVALGDGTAGVADGRPQVTVLRRKPFAVDVVSWKTTLTILAPSVAWLCW